MPKKLVAHRGQIADHPENTLESLVAAIECGATFLEVDIQLTSDLVPVLCHDATLKRTAGVDVDVRSNSFSEILAYSVDEAERLNHRFNDIKIPSLEQAIALLREYPRVQMFIELKQESFDVFGIESVVDQVLACIGNLPDQYMVISFNRDALAYLKRQSDLHIGWIVRDLGSETLQQAAELNPEFMFINQLRCTEADYNFSADPWDWVLYETSEVAVAEALFRRGVAYVESNDIKKLLPCFQSTN